MNHKDSISHANEFDNPLEKEFETHKTKRLLIEAETFDNIADRLLEESSDKVVDIKYNWSDRGGWSICSLDFISMKEKPNLTADEMLAELGFEKDPHSVLPDIVYINKKDKLVIGLNTATKHITFNRNPVITHWLMKALYKKSEELGWNEVLW